MHGQALQETVRPFRSTNVPQFASQEKKIAKF